MKTPISLTLRNTASAALLSLSIAFRDLSDLLASREEPEDAITPAQDPMTPEARELLDVTPDVQPQPAETTPIATGRRIVRGGA